MDSRAFSGFPFDWYRRALDGRWALTSPSLPGVPFVVTYTKRVVKVEEGETPEEVMARARG